MHLLGDESESKCAHKSAAGASKCHDITFYDRASEAPSTGADQPIIGPLVFWLRVVPRFKCVQLPGDHSIFIILVDLVVRAVAKACAALSSAVF